MTNPWAGLNADTANKKLYLDPAVISTLNRAFEPYEESLQTLQGHALDETTGYFGTPANPLASLVEKLFDGRGKQLTDYVTDQLTQSTAFIETARHAAEAMRSNQND
ncbi:MULTISPECIES: hypothetical protein [Mycobacterium]|uniref:ESX-1 secretion-associated protein n=1 Tax=Mycobacterium syngnathidarum TaxID=1908205 RepID=A0A1Q9WIF3_9MYCO|nr:MULTISPECIES: hypothetical protein [Mycobacterium]MCG7607451.1 hypothetical protein [Mycobacterium sp. CnD-18-1]OHU07058.1 hypothetical protein BKG61_04175 [Mycobacterium syngnathidarum]OLT98564.1 hypothetical protein BKG60_00910 [Mycobacterium syngnathidarum]TMS55767.1 hypothetical protein E0T84_00945 [Mycobacterium sp. DBP42]